MTIERGLRLMAGSRLRWGTGSILISTCSQHS